MRCETMRERGNATLLPTQIDTVIGKGLRFRVQRRLLEEFAWFQNSCCWIGEKSTLMNQNLLSALM